jgi:hypothetical protein
VVAQPSGRWAGFQVRLGGVRVDEAAAALTRMATTRVAHPPRALGVITATEYCYRGSMASGSFRSAALGRESPTELRLDPVSD